MINLVVTLNLDSSIHQDMREAKVLNKADSKFLKHVLDVHLKIQGDQQQINDIKSPPLQDIFGTQYINNENIRRMHKEHMKNEVLNFAREKD